MPALGIAQETGLLIEWLKAEGESVTKGEPLMVVETDKATEEIEAATTGILANVTASPGDEIPVGQVIALILAPGEEAPALARSIISTTGEDQVSSQPAVAEATAQMRATSLSVRQATPLASRIAADHDVDLSRIDAHGERIQKADVLAYIANQQNKRLVGEVGRVSPASPKARRLAGENSLDLTAIRGSGPNGVVLTSDIEKAVVRSSTRPPTEESVRPGPATPERIETITMSRKWRVMVQRLVEAWSTVPHFYLKRDVDAKQLIAWRESAQLRSAEKLSYTDLLVKLVAAALKQHPRVNASWRGDQILANQEVNIGLAVAVEDGLVVPVIHKADQLTLKQIASRRSELVSAAQVDRLTLTDLQGGTFTISNLGMFSIDEFSAIVNPPQAAILAVGRIADRVVPVGGQPVVRPILTLSMSCDHRVVDGARGAEFLDTLVHWIEDPMARLD